MNPLVLLLGLGLILANLLVSPQGSLLQSALGTGGPASAGAGVDAPFPGRAPVSSGGGGATVVGPPALPIPALPGAGGGAPALPPVALPPGMIP